jgi:hypothetical protein
MKTGFLLKLDATFKVHKTRNPVSLDLDMKRQPGNPTPEPGTGEGEEEGGGGGEFLLQECRRAVPNPNLWRY